MAINKDQISEIDPNEDQKLRCPHMLRTDVQNHQFSDPPFENLLHPPLPG